MENNTNGTSKIGCTIGANRVKIIDPNQYFGNWVEDAYKNIPVNQEDLTISVKLTTTRKARTILFSTNSNNPNADEDRSESKEKVTVNFIGSTAIGKQQFLTTKYTDLVTTFDEGVENDETLGITNIDIDFNTSHAPMVKIDFIDVRGSSVFQNEPSSSMETQNKYSTFFDLPYPLFELEIKGYYGKPVKYCLHMLKFNSKFNSSTGNFEISCEFVGYTYAMLSDILLGVLKAIPYTEIGKSKLEAFNADKKNKIITLVELIEKINKINESIKKVAADSEESKTVNTFTEANQLLDDLKNVMLAWSGFDEFNPKDVQNFFVLRRNKLTDAQTKDATQLNTNAREIINKYNDLKIEGLSLKVEDFIPALYYGDLTLKKIDPLNPDPLPSPSLSNPEVLASFKKSLYNFIKNSYSDTPISEESVFIAYDFRSRFEKIEIQKSAVDKSLKDTNRSLAEKLKDVVTKDLGFEPTVRNIVEIFTAMIEIFMQCIYDVSRQASTTDASDERYTLLKSVFDSNDFKSDIKQNDKNEDGKTIYYPWPFYSEKTGTSTEYVEKYLGANQKIRPYKLQIPELKFVEDLLKAFILSAKEEIQNEQNSGEERIFYPAVNPADTLLFITENYKDPYARNEIIDNNDVFRNMLLRAVAFLGYTNNEEYTTDDEIRKFAESEANSIIRGLTNQKLVPMLREIITKESILNATGTIDDVSRKVLTVSGDKYYYNYYFDSNSENGRKLLPINSDLNNKKLGDNFITAAETLLSEDVVFLTNYNAAPQSSATNRKVYDGGVYVKFFNEEDYNKTGTLVETNQETKVTLDYELLISNPAQAGFNSFAGPYGVQDITSIKFDGEKGPQTESSISLLFFNQVLSEYDFNSYFFGKTREASNGGKKTVSIYDYDKTKTKTYIRRKNITSKRDLFIPNTVLHSDLNKNRTLLNDLINNTGDVCVPYINQLLASPFRPLRVLANIPFTYTQRTDVMFSLFGSKFYYLQEYSIITYQNSNNQTVNISGEKYAKALLFLNTLPFEQGFNGPLDDDISDPAIVKLFNIKSGFVHIPRLWAAYIGGLFWRADNNDPIIDSETGNIIGGGSGTSDLIKWWKSCTGDYQPNEREEFERGPRSLLPKNFRIVGVQYPLFDDYYTPENDDLIKSIPDQVKNEFKKVFLDFVNGEGGYASFDSIREGLEIKKDTDNANEFCKILVKMVRFDSEGGYNISGRESEASDSYVLTENITNSFKNLENYNIVTPLPIHYQNIFSESSAIIRELRTNTDAMFLELKDTSTTMNTLLNAMKDTLVMANNSYHIWSKKKYSEDTTNRHSITISKAAMSTYLDKFIAVFKENSKNFSTTGQDEKILTELFGTANRDDILLILYRHCKNIYDKWVGGVNTEDKLIFQCGENNNPNSTRNTTDLAMAKKHGYNTPRLIDSFRFVNRSFKDIGDLFYINPLPIKEQIKNVPNTSAYNVISGLLNDNKFDFIALPTFINFYDDKEVESIFTPYPSVNTVEACGPSFVCVYVGQKSNRLDINGSKYENDGFDFRCDSNDIPDDFKNPLPTKDNENNEVGNYEQPVTVFQVNYSQQNQNIFKDIVLDQSEFTETEESLQIIQQIADKGSDTDRLFMGQNIYNVYAVRSYKAEVEMMGNAMIQPMMYFQLDNIPMFHGAYMIIRTKHNIKPNHMSTSFTGVRIRAVETPIIDVTDAYMSLIETLSISVNGKSANAIASGTFPPIVTTIDENQGVNGDPFRNNISAGKIDVSGIKKIKLEGVSDNRVIKEVVIPFSGMITDWFAWIESENKLPKENKHYAYVTSVFRDYETQDRLYKSLGPGKAAFPGTSNHGWGIAIDLQYFNSNGELISNKENVEAFFDINKNPTIEWLYNNSYKYGFYLPYELRNGGKTDEHWHWEYHGKSAACLWRRYPKIFKYTVNVKNIDDRNIREYVHNPKGKDGKEAIYDTTNCPYTIINSADGTGITSKAYPNVVPTDKELKMVDNLSGDWVNRAKQMIAVFEDYASKAYRDTDGKYRGGYGSPGKLNGNGVIERVSVTTTFTKKEAEDTLMYYIRNDYSVRVKTKLGDGVWNNLNDNRKAALVSYAYNVGSIRNSIANFIKANNFKSASEVIFNEPITSNKGTKVQPALIRRRKTESKVFDKPV